MTRRAVVVAILKYPGETVDPTQPSITVGPPSSNEITVTVIGDATREIRPGALASISVTARGIRARERAASVAPSGLRPGERIAARGAFDLLAPAGS